MQCERVISRKGVLHLDGYDQRDLLARKRPDKRREFFYWTDDGNLAGLRYDQWKAVFMEQKAEGFDVWQQPQLSGCQCCCGSELTRAKALNAAL